MKVFPESPNLAIVFHSDVCKMRDKNTNKGTGFTNEERASLKIRARLPFRVETLEEQAERTHDQMNALQTTTEKWMYLVRL